MLLIFTGDDVAKAKAEAARRAEGREVVRFGEGGEPFENVGEYLEQQGMFTHSLALVLDRPLDDVAGRDLVFERGGALVSASADVYVIQPDIGALDKKKLPKGAETITFEVESEPEAPRSNAFALVDAMQAGDRKRAWIIYRTLIGQGTSVEEIHGALSWAARSVVLASKTKSAAEAGMKPYPFNKAKGVVKTLKPGEAEAQSEELIRLYAEARSGRGDLEDLLEVYLLRKS